MTERLVQKLFLRIKPVNLLLALRAGPKYTTILSKEIDCTYSHTIKLLENFKKLNLVEFEKKGRIKIVKLTSIGEEISKHLENFVSHLNKLRERA